MNDQFARFAAWVAERAGSPLAFGMAFLIVMVWAMAGPLFGFSDGWLLVINTITTIVTFLMVFVIQADQNRTSQALQLKLDELLRSQADASDELIDAEHATAEKVEEQKRRITEGD